MQTKVNRRILDKDLSEIVLDIKEQMKTRAIKSGCSSLFLS